MMPEQIPHPNQPINAAEQAQNGRSRQAEFRKLPAVGRCCLSLQLRSLPPNMAFATAVTNAIRAAGRTARAIVRGHAAPALARLAALVDAFIAERNTSLRPVINATGVIIHTNLGRAPLRRARRQAVQAITEPYSNLEYDLWRQAAAPL
ncbi:MAG: hypothetical protein R2911_31420 [Caldilineaceae bacterium]